MSDTKFTKGPWTINPLDIDFESHSIFAPTLASGRRQLIAMASYDDNTMANAHLIASAPELYASLLDSHQLLVMLSDQVSKELRAQIYDQCANNSALLAKARGEA